MYLPQPIFGDKKIINTADCSFTFYSMEYSESYKTKSSGAYTESYHKFVRASGIIEKLKKQDVRLLDICLGIGMNLATTLSEISKNDIANHLHVVSVERDPHLLQVIDKHEILLPYNGYKHLRKALNGEKVENFSMELYISDARRLVDCLSGKFDVIYFDPFSKQHNAEMWTSEVFDKMYELLADDGVLVTYASSREVRDTMVASGFDLERVKSLKRKRPQPSLKATRSIG